jgi:hypothetical protein
MTLLSWIARKLGIVVDAPVLVEIPQALVDASRQGGAHVHVSFTVVQTINTPGLYMQAGPQEEQ